MLMTLYATACGTLTARRMLHAKVIDEGSRQMCSSVTMIAMSLPTILAKTSTLWCLNVVIILPMCESREPTKSNPRW